MCVGCVIKNTIDQNWKKLIIIMTVEKITIHNNNNIIIKLNYMVSAYG